MSKRSIVGLSLTLALATVAGSAFARRPPPLARGQEQAAAVLSTCGEAARSTSGYRDMLARAEPATQSRPASQAVRAPVVLRKMGDHVVLLCPGGRVHGPGGYRDLDRRFNAENPEVQMAKGTPAGAKACL